MKWNAIRPLNGSQAEGFEELCAQLARAESPPTSRFVRKGAPDAGVECYAILSDGTEWGWQAKYFDGFGRSQWSQLDKSVKTAIEKHPRLSRYFVCVPLDLPDARIERQMSAQERWNQHVLKWGVWASRRGMTVEFVFWGSHQLLDQLARSEHSWRRRFWFDAAVFDAAWFTARLDEALRSAGTRYTPEIHVDLPIARDFDAFGRTERFFDRVKAQARGIRQKQEFFSWPAKKLDPASPVARFSAQLMTRIEDILGEFADIRCEPAGPLPFLDMASHVDAARKEARELEHTLQPLEHSHHEEATAQATKNALHSHTSNPFLELQSALYGLIDTLGDTHGVLTHAARIASSRLLVLTGDAGTGKTHLLCDVAHKRIADGQPTILLLGQRFTSQAEPWSQALQLLDMERWTVEEAVGALEATAQAADCRALVIVDALNEGTGRAIWPSHLAAFLAHLERSLWVGVVLSVRSGYEELILPEEARRSAVVVTHRGFTDQEYDAARRFFDYYRLEFPSTPILAPEFSRPLFLKILCEGLQETGERRLPRGFYGITAVFELYLSAINKRLAKELELDERDRLVQKALQAFSKELADSGERWLALAQAKEVVDALLPGRTFASSLYRHMVMEGLFTEQPLSGRAAPGEEIVVLAYERFADHLVASILLDRHLQAQSPAAAFGAGGGLAFLADEEQDVAPGLLEALCIQVPERIGRELASLSPKIMERWRFGDAFRASLIWRSPSALTDETLDILDALNRDDHGFRETLEVLLTVATLPDHPLNANYLDKRLRKDAMPQRDAWWSTFLHEARDGSGPVRRLVEWASGVKPATVIDDETTDLCATSLAWMLTTSNRFLRDDATKALVSLLTGRLAAAGRLIERFTDLDDLYVVERVYAVAYGVAMRCHDAAEVGALAKLVYVRMFADGSPRPHILLRDYARGVVERALYLGSDIAVDKKLIRPPYKSQWPAISTEEEVKVFKPGLK